VLLHGGPTDSREFRRQISDLSDEFDVVAWDAPGCGRSSDPPETFRLPDYADCLAEFIEVLGLQRPHVLGLSWGGGLALELYGRHPAVLRSLVLASAYAGWAGSLPPEEVNERLERALRESEMPPEHLVSTWVPTFFSKSAPPELIAEVTAIVSEFHPAGIRTGLRAFAEADLRDVLARITVPTLLLYGDEDVRSPLQVAEALHATIPGARLVVMAGVGHVSDMEAPERFNAEVRGFLRSV
jgi:pimeloyl-ACP methyl ester carboxylesterase